MSTFHEPTPQTNPESSPRAQVLTIANEMIDGAKREGEFQFDGGWVARPWEIPAEEHVEGEVVDGVTFERDKLAYDSLDRVILSRHHTSLIGISWTNIRPNANTRTTTTIDALVGDDEETYKVSTKWSDVVPPEFHEGSINELKGALTDLQIRAFIAPNMPSRPLWKRLFGIMSQK